MGSYRLKYYEEKIGISVQVVSVKTSRIHCGVSRCGEMVPVPGYETRFSSDNLLEKMLGWIIMDLLAKYVHFILTEKCFLPSKFN